MSIHGWSFYNSLKVILVTASLLLLVPGWALAAQAVEANDPISHIEGLWREGRRNAAHAAVDSLLPLSRAAQDTLLSGRLLVMRGLMHTAIGNGGQGEAPLREGLSLVRAAGDVRWEMIALRWYGVALGQNLKDEESSQAYRALLDLAISEQAPADQAWAESGVAYQARRSGDLMAARDGYQRAVKLFRQAGDARGELFALNGLGNVLHWLSDYDGARRCYQETLTTSRRIGAAFTEALAANNLGTLNFSLGDPGEALANFRRAHELQMQDGNLREAIAAAHNIAICLTYLGEYDRSLDLLDETARICRERGYRELEYGALTQRGLVLTQQNRLAGAEAVFGELQAWPEPMPDARFLEATLGHAALLSLQERHTESLALLRKHASTARAFSDSALRLAYLARLGRQFNRTGQPRQALGPLLAVSAEAESLQLDDPLLLSLIETGSAYRDLGRPDSALTYYRQAAAVWERERQVPLDPEWRERRGVAGQTIYTELAALVLAGAATDGPATGQVARAYGLLQKFKARTLLERMSGPGDVSLNGTAATTLSELQRALQVGNEVLLDFFTGRRRSYLFVVTRNSLAVHELPAAAELKQKIGLYRDLVLVADPDSSGAALVASTSRTLWEMLLRPAAPVLAANCQVVFCPDGALNRLPLSLVLRLGTTGGSCHVVQRTPSASILVRLRGADQADLFPVRRLLAIAGTGEAGDEPLAAAAREVAWLGRRFAGVTNSLPDTVASVEALSGFDLIHLASHVRVSEQFPWRSTVLVRTAGGRQGALAAADIAHGQLTAQLTVLAGCESAGGKVVRGEGVMGLSSAFVAAGSPAVVASLWPVDDVATYRFMRAMYGSLAAGATVAEACQVAQEQLAGQSGFKAPRFWAGFVVIGDGGRRLALPSRHGVVAWQILLLVGVILLVAAGFLIRAQAKGRFL